jgi:hypothetical protein
VGIVIRGIGMGIGIAMEEEEEEEEEVVVKKITRAIVATVPRRKARRNFSVLSVRVD